MSRYVKRLMASDNIIASKTLCPVEEYNWMIC